MQFVSPKHICLLFLWSGICVKLIHANKLHLNSVSVKHILLVNTKGLGMAKLRRKPSPKQLCLTLRHDKNYNWLNKYAPLNPFSPCSCFGHEHSAGGMVSSAEDLLNWLIFQTSEGRNSDGDVVLDEEIWKETTRPNIQSGISIPTQPEIEATYSMDNYALGWFTGYYRGRQFQGP